jgi:hypothetical protein
VIRGGHQREPGLFKAAAQPARAREEIDGSGPDWNEAAHAGAGYALNRRDEPGPSPVGLGFSSPGHRRWGARRGPPYGPAVRLDPDDLSPVEWDTLEAIVGEPLDPNNTPWPEGTPALVKVLAWAGWGLWLSRADLRADDPR